MAGIINQKTISIKDLSLWDENARFPDKYFSKSEPELIYYFCSKKDFKIVDLAESIVREFDLPQIEKLIIYTLGGVNITLEGNRRLAVYKLLNNPNLIETQDLQQKFRELKSKIKIDDSFSLECLVTDDKEIGFRYIERKHLYGNNEVSWKDNERAHHKARRGKASQKELFKVEITKIIKNLNIPESMKEQVLGSGYVTNFWRILESSPAWDEYGFVINKSGELKIKDAEFEEKLKVIILNILQKKDFLGNKLDSRSLNKNKEKEEYIKSITKADFKKTEEKINECTKTNLFDEKAVEINCEKTKLNPKSSTRNHLIPKTCRLDITPKKINNIYRELRDDLLLDDSNKAVPNAVGVLFRVFLEVSLDYFAKMNEHGFKQNTTISQKIPWVVEKLKSKGCEDKIFNNIKKVGSANKEKSYLSIDNFHEYVHSYTTQPTSSELISKWDNLEEFFIVLWETLKPKK